VISQTIYDGLTIHCFFYHRLLHAFCAAIQMWSRRTSHAFWQCLGKYPYFCETQTTYYVHGSFWTETIVTHQPL